jgi:hypothetical protein
LLRVGALVIGAALVAAHVTASRAQSGGNSEAVRELSLLLAEQKEITLKVRQSVAQREQYDQQLKELDGQSAALKSTWEGIEALRPAIRQLCSGKVAPDKLAEAKQKCDAALAPFNRQVEDFNTKKKRIETRRQLLQQEETERAAATARLEARGELLKQRIAVLEVALGARPAPAQAASCAERCREKSGEAAAQCVRSCIDEGRATAQQPAGQPVSDQFDSVRRTARPTPQQTIMDHFGRFQEAGRSSSH